MTNTQRNYMDLALVVFGNLVWRGVWPLPYTHSSTTGWSRLWVSLKPICFPTFCRSVFPQPLHDKLQSALESHCNVFRSGDDFSRNDPSLQHAPLPHEIEGVFFVCSFFLCKSFNFTKIRVLLIFVRSSSFPTMSCTTRYCGRHLPNTLVQ